MLLEPADEEGHVEQFESQTKHIRIEFAKLVSDTSRSFKHYL